MYIIKVHDGYIAKTVEKNRHNILIPVLFTGKDRNTILKTCIQYIFRIKNNKLN